MAQEWSIPEDTDNPMIQGIVWPDRYIASTHWQVAAKNSSDYRNALRTIASHIASMPDELIDLSLSYNAQEIGDALPGASIRRDTEERRAFLNVQSGEFEIIGGMIESKMPISILHSNDPLNFPNTDVTPCNVVLESTRGDLVYDPRPDHEDITLNMGVVGHKNTYPLLQLALEQLPPDGATKELFEEVRSKINVLLARDKTEH